MNFSGNATEPFWEKVRERAFIFREECSTSIFKAVKDGLILLANNIKGNLKIKPILAR